MFLIGALPKWLSVFLLILLYLTFFCCISKSIERWYPAMIIKWRWVQNQNRCWYTNLIGYSKRGKEHIEFLNEAIKRLQRSDCVRVIIEKGDFEE